MARPLEPQQLPQAVAEHQKCEQSLKGQDRHNTQIDRGDRLRVVAKERFPALRRRAALHHVFRYRRLGDLEAKHQQFAMDPGSSVGSGHTALDRSWDALPSSEISSARTP